MENLAGTFGVMLLFLSLMPGRAPAGGNLRVELGVAADGIAKAIKAAGETSVVVGQFTGPPQLATSSGSGIVKVLADKLRQRGIEVKTRPALGIKGEFRDVVDAESDQLAAQIKGELVDRKGKVLFSFERGVFGDATLPELFGITANLPPKGSPEDRDKQMQKGLDAPTFHVAGNHVLPIADSPYGMEILVKVGDRYVARATQNDEGLAFVPIGRAETYAVRLINNSPYDAGVTLTVDGISMFAFSEKNYSQMIVRSKDTTLIKGWHRSNEKTEEFLVTEYSKSAAAELHSTCGIGAITATFSAAWPQGQDPPPDEPPNPREHARSANATGRGAQIVDKFVEVRRHFGVVRAAVSVRYTK